MGNPLIDTLNRHWPTKTVSIYSPVTEVDQYGGQSTVDWTLEYAGLCSVQQKNGVISGRHNRETHEYSAMGYIAGKHSFKVGSKLVDGSDTYLIIDVSDAAGLGKVTQIALRASGE